MKKYRNVLIVIFAFLLSVCLVACSSTKVVDKTYTSENTTELERESTNNSNNSLSQEERSDENMITLMVNGHTLTAELADNSSARALSELLVNGPLTINMSDYGSMEKVGNLGTSLSTNNEQITTEAGDIILYQGSMLVIYYAPNSWNFTRLGKIMDVTAEELQSILGEGNISITVSNQHDSFFK